MLRFVPKLGAGVLLSAALLTGPRPQCAAQQASQRPVQYTRNALRSLSGTVTAGREPIRGAVVQIEAEDTMVIQSYVTDERGIYHFRNLRPDADFRIWATFRGHKSKLHEMSKFDRKPDREIALEIDLTKE